jgi:uncharacterized cofD-like protein
VTGPAVVALGGGHGLAASLTALRRITDDLTAVVTVADDGGSSGRLREEFGGLPPGDLRMALAALCGDDEWGATWSRLAQHRFAGEGPLAGHAVGNLLLAGLWEITDDPIAGLQWMARLLGAHGTVLPMSAEPLEIIAAVDGPSGPRQVRGQVAVATCADPIQSVRMEPATATAAKEALAALQCAELAVLGPGSWFTSVLPHLLLPDLEAAIRTGPTARVVVLNLTGQPGETEGFEPHHHLEVLAAHSPDLTIDAVLADISARGYEQPLVTAAAQLQAQVVFADVADRLQPGRHDPDRLASAIARLSLRGSISPWR